MAIISQETCPKRVKLECGRKIIAESPILPYAVEFLCFRSIWVKNFRSQERWCA